jgi:hypothetical protein
MALTDHDQARIRQYLLGQLTGDDQEKIEERLMVEDDLFEELEISKGELIEEYRAGELNRNEQKWLQEHYLSSPEGQQRRAFVAAIDYLALSSARTPSLFERLRAFFKSHPWVPATVAAAAVVVIAVLLFLPQQHTAYSITLPHMLPTRSTEGTNPLPSKIILPPNTYELRAALELPKQFPQGTRFEVQLDNQTSTKAVSVIEQNEKLVTVAIPTSDLPHGEYLLKLTAVMTDGRREEIPGGYRFDIK